MERQPSDSKGTGKAPAASSDPPIALRIPAELWARVSRQLEYFDLKSLARVCRAFKAIFEVTSALQAAPIPQAADGSAQAGKGLAIHPMLEKVNLVHCEDVNTAEILRGEGENLIAFDYPAADEYATAPACTKLKLEMNERKCGIVRSPNGVKVRHVMTRAIKYWHAPATGNVAKQIRREGGWSASQPVTRYGSIQGDERYLFEGWDYAKVQADGITVLLAWR